MEQEVRVEFWLGQRSVYVGGTVAEGDDGPAFQHPLKDAGVGGASRSSILNRKVGSVGQMAKLTMFSALDSVAAIR